MKQKLYFLIFFLLSLKMFSQNATHLNFDGVNDYVYLGTSINNAIAYSKLTVEAWIKVPDISGTKTIISNHSGGGGTQFNLRIDNNQFNGFLGFGAVNVNSSNIITPNTWYHVAMVWNGSTLSLYVNGSLNGVTNAGYNIPLSGQPFSIGITGFGGEIFSGEMDEVRIWKVARTQAQISASRFCQLEGTQTGLIAYYKFNQGIAAGNNSSQTTLTATNGPNGTLNGFALTGTTSNWVGGSPVLSNAPSVTTPVVYNLGDIALPLTATSGGTGLLWYTSATGGTGSATAPTPSTAIGGTTSYWVSSTNANGCESQRVQIIVNVIASVPATHLKFDGVNDYVVANSSNLPLGNSSRTVEFWVKTAQVSGSHTLFSYGNFAVNERIALVNAGGKLYFSAHFNDYNTNITIADNNWHHVAFTFDGASKIYLDGVLIATPTLNAFATAGTQIILGTGNISLYEPFAGNLDEVRIWNTARTAGQINGSKNCELQGTETGLVAYYKFNQGLDTANNAGTTTLTATTGANGSLNNFALNGTTSNWFAGSPVITGIVVPSAPTALAQSFCGSGTVANLVATGSDGLLNWYNVATGGTPLASSTELSTGTYYVSESNTNGCESGRTSVEVTINTLITYYTDIDGDGYGNDLAESIISCNSIEGYVTNNLDCNDNVASINPGAVDVCYDGIDNDCNGIIDNVGLPGGCTPIVSAMPVAQCGTTASGLATSMYATNISGAQGYRFKVTNMSTMAVQTIDRPVNNLAFSAIPGVTYDTQYQVEIGVKYNNVWQPFFGSPCFINTPNPVSTPGAQCGTTLSAMNQWVYTTYVPNVTAYRFKVTNLVTNAEQVFTSSTYKFNFTQLASRAYNTTYSVEVSLRNTNGVFLPYNTSECNVTTPSFPESYIRDSQCDYTALSNSEMIAAVVVPTATVYRFFIYNNALEYGATLDRSLNTFNLNMFTGLTPGATYSVQVSVKIGDEFGPFGKVCSLTVPGLAREENSVSKAIDFKAVAYPNPFAENFKLDVNTSSEEVIKISVYDMIGKQVEQRQINVSDVASFEVGNNYPSGVYNVIVTQGENTQTLRVIKR